MVATETPILPSQTTGFGKRELFKVLFKVEMSNNSLYKERTVHNILQTEEQLQTSSQRYFGWKLTDSDTQHSTWVYTQINVERLRKYLFQLPPWITLENILMVVVLAVAGMLQYAHKSLLA